MTERSILAGAILAMATVVVASNVLVAIPLHGSVGGVALGDLLTYGAFTYPFAFLVTDVTNRRFGPARARLVALVGFACAVALSAALADPRIAVASGTAFLTAQLLDIVVFNRLRGAAWWRAPLASSVLGSAVDTAIFFTLAFSAAVPLAPDAFATEASPFLALGPDAPRWVSWAVADFGVKLTVAAVALLPYRALTARLPVPATR